MSNLIDRQEAIDLLKQMRKDGDMIPWEGKDVFARIRKLPSAQPEIKQQAINSSDCIDRRAALDTLRAMQTYKLFAGDDMLLIDQAGAQTELMLLPPAQPDTYWKEQCQSYEQTINKLRESLSTQPEITHEQAVEYLQSTGWLHEHDLQMMLDGVHRQTAQPEIVRCKNCKYWIPYDWMFSEIWQSRNIADYSEDEIGCECCDMSMKADDYCSRAERREVTE